MADGINPNAHEWMEEFVKAYVERSNNIRKHIPKISVPRDTIKTLASRNTTTEVSLSSTGTPVNIPVTYTEDTVNIVDFSGKTDSIYTRYFSNKDVVGVQTELVMQNFLMNENSLFLNTLGTASTTGITVDATADNTAATAYEVADAFDMAIGTIEMYTTVPMLYVFGTNTMPYLYKKTPEMKKPIDTLREHNVAMLPMTGLTDTAYMIPLDKSILKMVQVESFYSRIEEENYDLASIFGRESIAFIYNQPEIIQKLDFTVTPSA